MKKNIVDVIIPVFNAEGSISNCINSVLNQDLLNSVILINDGSVDSTKSILIEYQRKYKQIKLINLERNGGLVNALNIGIENSSAPFIARLDADDTMMPNRLEKQYKFLIKNDLDLIGGQIIGEQSGKLYKIYSGKTKNISKMDLFFSSSLFHPTWFGKSQVFNIKYQTMMPVEDIDFLYRAVQNGFRLRNILEPVTIWNETDENKITNANKYNHVCLVYIVRLNYIFFNKVKLTNSKLLGIKQYLNKNKYLYLPFKLIDYIRISILKIFF